MTEPPSLQQLDRTFVRLGKRKFSYFSGCDYFRLSGHPQVIAALREGVKEYGLNVAASRLTTGNHRLYVELESALTFFFAAPDALLVSAGSMTNLVVAQALSGNFSHALIDERSHPALGTAARLLDCPVLIFKHRSVEDLTGCVRRCGPGARLIVLTDGMFSHDGSVAPLADYLRVLSRDAMILVDDAHGAGVLGATGKGTLEHDNVSRHRIIQTITLSKAFGAWGGAILGTTQLRKNIFNKSSLFVGSTPAPLPLAAAALAALRIFKNDPSFKKRLARNADYVRRALRDLGAEGAPMPGPIFPFVPKNPRAAGRFHRQLLAARIFPPFLQYPGGSAQGYFRFVISSEHSRGQLDGLVRVLSCNLGARRDSLS